MAKNSSKVKYKNKKGCWHRIWPSLFTILIVLVTGILFFLDHFLSGSEEFQKYVDLLNELENTPTDAQMAPDKITSADRDDFENLINGLVSNNNSLPLFDENGNFIYSNLTPEDLTIASGSEMTLDKTSLACLIESSLGGGWVSDCYEDGENLLILLQITTLETTDGRTTVTAVGKLKLKSLLDDASAEAPQGLDVLGALPDALYFVYTASFSYGAENTDITSSMWINQLTASSNDLLTELIFEEWLDSTDTTLEENLNSVMEWTLAEFDNMLTMWDCSAEFTGTNIVITKN